MKTTKYFPDKRQRNKNHLTNVFNPTFFFLTETTKRIYFILSNLDRSEAKTLTFMNYKDKECFFLRFTVAAIRSTYSRDVNTCYLVPY